MWGSSDRPGNGLGKSPWQAKMIEQMAARQNGSF